MFLVIGMCVCVLEWVDGGVASMRESESKKLTKIQTE